MALWTLKTRQAVEEMALSYLIIVFMTLHVCNSVYVYFRIRTSLHMDCYLTSIIKYYRLMSVYSIHVYISYLARLVKPRCRGLVFHYIIFQRTPFLIVQLLIDVLFIKENISVTFFRVASSNQILRWKCIDCA